MVPRSHRDVLRRDSRTRAIGLGCSGIAAIPQSLLRHAVVLSREVTAEEVNDGFARAGIAGRIRWLTERRCGGR